MATGTDKIDMSLEDIIKSNRRSGKGGATRRGSKGAVGGGPSSPGFKGAGKGGAISRGNKRGRGGVRGSTRGGAPRGEGPKQGPSRGKASRRAGPRGGVNRRPAPMPYVRSTKVPDVWKHDLYEGDNRTRSGVAVTRGPSQPVSRGISRGDGTGTIRISNLDFGVNDSDITGLFAEFGTIKKSAVHYDKSGRSLESAEVVYENSLSAIKAMKRYNDVPLDGKLMKITIVGGGEEQRTMASRLGTKPAPLPRKITHQSRGGYGDQRQVRNGGGGRGRGVGGGSGRDVNGGSGRGVNGGSGRGAGGGKGAGAGKGAGGGKGSGDGSGRGAGASGGRGGRGGTRRGRSGANQTRKVVSKVDLDAQLDAYRMETD